MKQVRKSILKKDYFSEEKVRKCDYPNCSKEGLYKAPKSRDLKEYYWFCLDHVQKYNSLWNYYKGMTISEIEKHQKNDVTWQRPTWPMNKSKFYDLNYIDLLKIFKNTKHSRKSKTHNSDVSFALSVMNLSIPLSLKELKARYKKLVKKYHPDCNGGNKTSEEKLKLITNAFSVLKKIAKLS